MSHPYALFFFSFSVGSSTAAPYVSLTSLSPNVQTFDCLDTLRSENNSCWDCQIRGAGLVAKELLQRFRMIFVFVNIEICDLSCPWHVGEEGLVVVDL